MTEKRFIIVKSIENFYSLVDKEREDKEQILILSLHKEQLGVVCDLLNEQSELIEELYISDEMGWKRAERFEKKCPKELHNKKMYIKRLEYKVQKFKEENEQLLKYKYFVKAVEVFTDCPISETIADYSDGELFDEKEQLEFGKKMLEQEKELVEDE